MLTFPPEILQGLRDNGITELNLSVTPNRQELEFKTMGIGIFGINYLVTLSAECSAQLPLEGESSIFSESGFNDFKEALILNTSLKFWSNTTVIYNSSQCDYLNKITLRNIDFARMKGGITLFHLAAMRGDFDVIQLCSWQAKKVSDFDIKCQNGKTPLDYARDFNQPVIVKFLTRQREKVLLKTSTHDQMPHTGMDKLLSDKNKQHIFTVLDYLAA